MFRKVIAMILLFAFVAQMFDKSIIVIDYYFNKASYLRNCENRYRPQLHCNGKCQMMKKMKEEEKKEQREVERRLGINEVVSSKSFFFSITERKFTLLIPSHFSLYNEHPVDRSYFIFHPPQAA